MPHAIARQAVPSPQNRQESRVNNLNTTVNSMSSDVHGIKNDTKEYAPCLNWFRTDGAEIGEPKLRVDQLEKQS